MKALLILMMMVTPAVAETLEADLAEMRTANAWPVRGTLLGWTADHRMVYRSLICDTDEGGGRGPSCDLALCVAAARVAYDPCIMLESVDLNRGEEVRQEFDSDAVVGTSSRQLAMLGALEAGRPLAASTFRTTVGKGVLAIERTGAAKGKDRAVIAMYRTPEAAEQAADRPQNVSDPAVTAVAMSRDGKCVAVLGHYRFDGHYEALATSTPRVFTKVICTGSP